MNAKTLPEEIQKIRNIPIAFIVGCGRSGTTLLQSLLNSHPNIIATPECNFIALLYPHFGKIKNWKEKDVRLFVDALYSIRSFALWLLDKEELTNKLLSIMEFADYQLLCKIVFYEMRKEKENVLVIIDKNPINSLFVRKLLKIFPGATFIHIIREPKDCVNAHLKRFYNQNTFFLAWYWKGFNASIESVKKQLPGIFFTVLYEKFVKSAEQTLQEMCKFLHVPFDNKVMENQFPEMLPLYKENKTFERIKIVHEGLLSPVNDSNIGKWRKEMNTRDVAITDAITGEYALSKYGYEREVEPVKISYFIMLRKKIQYYSWQAFTKLRYTNYAFNMYYRKVKKNRSKNNNNILQ